MRASGILILFGILAFDAAAIFNGFSDLQMWWLGIIGTAAIVIGIIGLLVFGIASLVSGRIV